MKPARHHDEICHHLVAAEKRAERFDHAADLIGFVYEFVISFLGGEVPVPRVFERRDLRFAVAARFVAEQDVVISITIERRIEINEVNALVFDVIAEDL